MEAIAPIVRAELDRPLVPDLPAELAWFVENDDHPLRSRTIVTLAPGAPGPTRRAQPVLYSFDAADRQDLVGAAGGRWFFTGPVRDERSAPNVGLPLSAIGDGGLRLGDHASAQHLAVSEDGTWLAAIGGGELVVVDAATGERRVVLGEADLGRTLARGLTWWHDGRILLDLGSVAGGPEPAADAMTPGRWAVDPDTGERARLGPAVGTVHHVFDDGRLLVTRATERRRFAPQDLLLLDPGSDGAAEVFATGLHDRARAAALDDGSIVWIDGQSRLVRFVGPGAPVAMLATMDEPEVLLEARDEDAGGPGGVFDVRAHGGWVVVSRGGVEWRRTIHLVRISPREHHVLGPGLRPRWGRAD
jgi:hypothetical protein